jgi:cold shock CspA family protein
LREVPRGLKPARESSDPARVPRQVRSEAQAFVGQPMTRGVVMKVVRSFGSEWGRVRVAGTGLECFFNRSSLVRPRDFEVLALGQEVKFVEEPDRVNGTHATRMTIINAVVADAKGIAK